MDEQHRNLLPPALTTNMGEKHNIKLEGARESAYLRQVKLYRIVI